jgi:uroporphyrin-III C-methyltransferase
MMRAGKVFLVGAGPGDPELLTRRAFSLMHSCDVVCYDKLVSPAILACVPAHVQLHEMGYRGYHNCHIDYGMHPEVINFALQGKQVLRLKAGDPCIFGRTTEECRELNEQGIAYEIIPGITAALGAAAYSGFPLTSAGTASDVTFASGHKSSETLASWAALGQSSGTLVLYMGAKKLAQHAQQLILQGRCPTTPVAHISSATCANHTVTKGSLATIGERVLALNNDAPALVIMGGVVDQADELGWRHLLPLAGKRVLLCGDYAGSEQLKAAGAELFEAAAPQVESFVDTRLLAELSQLPALHFSDVNAVSLWWQGVNKYQWDLRRFAMPIGAANAETAQALQQLGIIAEPVPADTVALFVSSDGELNIADSTIYSTIDSNTDSNAQRCIGSQRPVPLRFQLPDINWLLVADVTQAEALLSQQPGLKEATIIGLNEAARQWANAQTQSHSDLATFEALQNAVYEVPHVA